MSYYNPKEIKPGDKVQVPYHKTQTLHGIWIEPWDSLRIGVVTRLFDDSYFKGSAPEDTHAEIRVMCDPRYAGELTQAAHISYRLKDLIVIERGEGKFELGITHPYTEQELFDQRLARFESDLASADKSYEGSVNAPTYVAHLYISQEPKLVKHLRTCVRKDGSINPVKVAKAFKEAGLVIDDWAIAPVLVVPDEFKAYTWRWEQSVNWEHVARELAQDFRQLIKDSS